MTGACPDSDPTAIEPYFARLQFARDNGYSNRTVFSFGFMLGQSAINPNGWTAQSLRAAMVKLKRAFPELPGVVMFGTGPRVGFANATNSSTATWCVSDTAPPPAAADRADGSGDGWAFFVWDTAALR